MRSYKLPKKVEYEIIKETDLKEWFLKNWNWNIGNELDIKNLKSKLVQLIYNEMDCIESENITKKPDPEADIETNNKTYLSELQRLEKSLDEIVQKMSSMYAPYLRDLL